MKEVHIGSVIKQKVKENHLSVNVFAKMMHCSESNVYSIFTRKSIDIELLERASEILDYDFKSEYKKGDATNQDCIAVIKINKQKLSELLKEDKSINLIGSKEFYK